jgi:hypothetical protein
VACGEDGRCLLHCHAGCTLEAVCRAIDLEPKDLFVVEPRQNTRGESRIVATYDYQDETGSLLYQVVRYHPKDFRQRRPDGSGGWLWNLKGVRRVLYRLMELLAADPATWVFVVEGEKDADNLVALGLLATCNAGGAGKWQDTYSEALRGRRVAVIPDGDAPGWTHAHDVARRLHGIAEMVRIVDLGQIKGFQGKDVSDWIEWLDSRTGEELAGALVEMAEVAPAYQPDMETPMVRSYRWQPFPVDVLPPACRRFVRETAEALGVDASYVALPALAVLAGAVGNTRRIALSRSWTAPAVLWPVIVGESGTLKGPVLKAATRPAMKRQRKALDAHKTAMSVYESEAEDHKAALKAWKTGGRDKGEPAPVAPERPPLERCIVSDVTVEALADRLQDNPRGLLLAREELSGWLGSFNAYKSGKGADEAHWLTMFDAVTLVVDRKSTERPTIFVPRAAVSLTGGIQPGILRRMLTQEYQESGMAARLLMTMPPRRAKRWTDREVSRLTEQAFGDVYANLWTLAPVLDDGELHPLDLPLSAEALLLWVDFVNQHGREAVELTGALAAAWSKLEGYAARLALVVELAGWAESPRGDGRGPAEVSAESVRAGIALVEWAGNETRRIYSMLAEDGEERTIREVLELVERRGGSITARELQQAKHFGTSEEAEEVLHQMVAASLGQWVEMPPGPRGGRPSKCFRLASLGQQEAGRHAETDGSCYETPDGDSASEVS